MARDIAEEAAYKAGVLDQRLAGYDAHFAAINGSVSDTARELQKLNALIEERLSEKAERTRVSSLSAQLSDIQLQLNTLGQTVVLRDGPIADRISANTSRLDVLEAGLPAKMLKLKQELQNEIETVHDEVKDAQASGSLRLWAAAGSGFAATIVVLLAVFHAAGLL